MREDSHVMTEAGIGVKHPQAKECQALPRTLEAGKGKEGFCPTGSTGSMVLPTSSFWDFKPLKLWQ